MHGFQGRIWRRHSTLSPLVVSRTENKTVTRLQLTEPGMVAWKMYHEPYILHPRLTLQDMTHETVEIGQPAVQASANTRCSRGRNSELRVLTARTYQRTPLESCVAGGTGYCVFTPLGSIGVYPQRTLIGNPFANCASSEPVTQTLEGSTTITNNWNVEIDGSFGLPLNSLFVKISVGGSRSTTLTQTVSYVVYSGMQSAIVGIANFNGTYGNMLVLYKNGTSIKAPHTIYFSYTGEPAMFQRLDVPCGQPWPIWNSTPELLVPSGATKNDSRSQKL